MKLSDADNELIAKMRAHVNAPRQNKNQVTYTAAGVSRLLEIIALLQDELKKNDPHLRH